MNKEDISFEEWLEDDGEGLAIERFEMSAYDNCDDIGTIAVHFVIWSFNASGGWAERRNPYRDAYADMLNTWTKLLPENKSEYDYLYGKYTDWLSE